MGYLTFQALRNLDGYKYGGVDLSFLGNNVLNPYWNWVVSWVPLWVAPNALTLLGFLCVLANFLTLAYYCPGLTGCHCPTWAYASFAVGIFLYQTLDNIDGKQARRTRSSSPLGELFDHGCDSLFTTLAGSTMVNAGSVGPWVAFAALQVGFATFYLAHWEEYHTGQLVLGRFTNPTEGQWIMIFLLASTAIFGQSFWEGRLGGSLPSALSARLPPSVLTLRTGEVLTVFMLSLAVLMMLYNVMQVALWCARTRRRSFVEACQSLLPFVMHASASCLWFAFGPGGLMHWQPLLCVIYYGVVLSYLVDRILLDRITKCEFATIQPMAVLSVVGAVLGTALARFLNRPDLDRTVFLVTLVVAMVLFVHFIVSVIAELCDYLGIRAFSIPYPPPMPPAGYASPSPVQPHRAEVQKVTATTASPSPPSTRPQRSSRNKSQ